MSVNQSLIAYADCFSGISGDMFLGAFLDAGLPEETLLKNIALLGLKNYEIFISEQPGSIKSTRIKIDYAAKQPHRSWLDIKKIIEQSSLSSNIKLTSLAIFKRLAEAEAHVHGTSPEEIHFHEVGGIDSIVDIVGAAIGLDYFNIKRLHCSPLPMPSGWVDCQHGLLPLPAPAVAEVLKNIPVYGINIDTEMVTPTGAAIIAATACEFGPMPPMAFSEIGYGAGSKKLPNGQPNLFRLIIGKSNKVSENQEVIITETNLDDWSPETYPYLCDKLLSHGALDVVLIPIHMKKGRPGFTIQVMSSVPQAFELQQILLEETSAIGLRYRKEQRCTLPRRIDSVDTPWGKIKVKIITAPGGDRITPEYEDCKKIAENAGVPISSIYDAVRNTSNTKKSK